MSENKVGICITIPQNIKWEEYKEELEKTSDWTQVMNFKVANLPKNLEKGARVYLCYKGQIIGWQTFVGTYIGEFDCTTTGKEWSGGFIQRSGPFHYLKTPIPHKGFRGFKYINYTINETKNNANNLLTEVRSINEELQKETIKLLNIIEKNLDGNKKQFLSLKNVPIFKTTVNINTIIYNRKTVADYLSILKNVEENNYFDFKQNTLFYTLFFIDGKSVESNKDSIAHELSHVYQSFLTNTKLPVNDINIELHKHINSENIFEKKLAYLLYLSDSNEQDSMIQGLESIIKNKSFSETEIIYENSYVKVSIDTLEKLIKQFIEYKNEFLKYIPTYKQYNLDYQRILLRSKEAYKRLKLKVGHILSVNQMNEKNKRTPTIKDLKNLL